LIGEGVEIKVITMVIRLNWIANGITFLPNIFLVELSYKLIGYDVDKKVFTMVIRLDWIAAENTVLPIKVLWR
jgi:hypothetical protein